jgi:hypothetical protein
MTGSSPGWSAVTHEYRIAVGNTCFHLFQKRRPGSASRKIALDLRVPLGTISFSEPRQECGLLFGGQRFNHLLDLRKVHVCIVLCPGRLTVTICARQSDNPDISPNIYSGFE